MKVDMYNYLKEKTTSLNEALRDARLSETRHDLMSRIDELRRITALFFPTGPPGHERRAGFVIQA